MKRSSSLPLLLAVLCVSAVSLLYVLTSSVGQLPATQQTAQVSSSLSNGLVGWWKLDDASGSSAADSSGNGNTATLYGNPLPQWTAGEINGALSFTAANGDSLVTPALNMSATGVETVAFWMNGAPGSSGSPVIFESTSNFNNSQTGVAMFYNDSPTCPSGTLDLELKGNAGYDVDCYAYPSSGWHQYSAIFNKAAAGGAEISLYVDGSLQSPVSQPSALQSNNTNDFGDDPFYFMSRSDSVSYATGILDDIRIYSRALSASEISSLVNVSAAPVSTQFSTGQQVQVDNTAAGTSYANIRQTPAGTVLGTQTNGAIGTVSSLAPVAATLNGTSVIWWDVNFPTGASGWLGQDVLTAYTAPVVSPVTISSISASAITSNSATISWTTSPANSLAQVKYGLTSAYGSNTALSSASSVTLTGLQPATTYHYQISAQNSAGSVATSQDVVFTTNPAPIVTYALTTSVTGSGSVTSSPTGINCSPSVSGCSANFNTGLSIALTATPASGYSFAGWSGACSGTSATCTVTLSANASVSATFTANSTGPVSKGFTLGEKVQIGFTANVRNAPSGGAAGSVIGTQAAGAIGTVLSSTPIYASVNGTSYYWWDLSFPTAPTAGWVAEDNLTPYTAANTDTLSVMASGSGTGTVSCGGSPCPASVPAGTQITLNANATGNSSFGGWTVTGSSNTCGASTSCTLTITGNTTASASFLAGVSSNYSITSGVSAGGTISPVTATIPSGSTQTFTITPNSGYQISAVLVDGSAVSIPVSGGTYTFSNVTANHTILATFIQSVTNPTTYPVSVSVSGTGSGTVTSSPAGILCSGSTCSGSFNTGTTVTLSASPTSGTFGGWSGSCSGTSSTCSVSSAASVTATFNAVVSQGSCPVSTCYYVDGNVASAGNGSSWATAMKTIPTSGLSSGSIVYISGGPSGSTETYSVGTFSPESGVTYQIGQDSAHDGIAIFSSSGTFVNPANNVSIIGELGNGSDGIQHFENSGASFIAYTSGTQLTNFRLGYINFGKMTGATSGTDDDLYLSPVNGFRFDHNYLVISGTNANAFAYFVFNGTGYDQNLIDDNTIYLPHGGLNPNGPSIGADGIESGGSVGYSIYNNTFIGYDMPYVGTQHQDAWQDTGGSSYIKLYGNTCYDMGNSCFFADATFGGFSNVMAYNNKLFLTDINFTDAQYPSGIDFWTDGGASNGTTFSNVIIANNVAVGYGTTPTGPYGSMGNRATFQLANESTHSTTFSNAVMANNVSVPLGNQTDAGYTNVANDDGSGAASSVDNVSLTLAQAESYFTSFSSALDTASALTMPTTSNSGLSDNFALTSAASALISQGANESSWFTTDAAGTTRPSSGAWDIGPYQNINGTGGTTGGTAPTATLTASAASITSGQSDTLSWSSTGATSCTGTGFTASATSGSVSVSPTVTTSYSVTCTGAGGTSSPASVTVTVGAPTVTAPTVPAGLTATAVSPSQVALSWTASSKGTDAIAGYHIYRNGAATPVGTITSGTTYTDSGLSASTAYTYTVAAYDTAGNSSGLTAAVSATTWPALSTKFTNGSQVQTAAVVNVRTIPVAGLAGSVLGTQATGAIGTVSTLASVGGGPIYATINAVPYYWWYITFPTSPSGWVAEDNLNAYTAPATYAITVTQGSNGTISPSSASVSSGGSQTFTITPNAGYQISAVLVDGSAVSIPITGGTYTFSNVTANHTISASFSQAVVTQTYSVSVSVSGTGSGTVTSSPAGILCSGSTCSGSFNTGTTVTLSAAATNGATFNGWSGSCSGTSSTCSVSSAASVTATFNATVGSGGTTCPVSTCYYVDGKAAAGGNGTSWSSAWNSLSSISSPKAGSIVYISGGPAGSSVTYSVGSTWTPPGGSAGAPVTYQIGQDSSHDGTAIFSASGYAFTPNSYTTITGQLAGDANCAGASVTTQTTACMHFQVSGSQGAYIGDTSGVHIAYVNLGTNLWTGVDGDYQPGSTGFEFDHNYGEISNVNADHFLYIHPNDTAYDGTKIHDNTVYVLRAPYGDGVDAFQIDASQGSSNGGWSMYNNFVSGYGSTYQCTASECQHQDGLQPLAGSYIKVYGNIFQNLANSCVFFDGYGGSFNHVRIYDNICQGSSGYALGTGIDLQPDGNPASSPGFTDVVLDNNLSAGAFTAPGIEFGTPPGGDSEELATPYSQDYMYNNITLGAGSFDNYGSPITTGDNVSDPAASDFASYVSGGASNNYQLTSSASDLIGKGANQSSYFTTDFSGVTRPASGAWDIGPYQNK